jgi:hypothetical protein
MSTELDDQEVLNIGDDSESGDNLSDAKESINTDDTDRGDNFVDPDAEGEQADRDAEAKVSQDGDSERPGGEDTTDAGGKAEGEGNTGNIPASRLGEVARAKTAAVAIGKGLVDGSVDRALIDELGGYDAVVKAIANRELSVADLQAAAVGEQQQPPSAAAANPVDADPNAPSNWDLDKKYIEYQELVDAGEVKESATLLRQIGKEERARERKEEDAQLAKKEADDFALKLVADYPVLANKNSPEHVKVKDLAGYYRYSKGVDMITSLKMAIADVGLTAPGEAANDAGNTETAQQRTLRLRNEESLRKGARSSVQQPPPMGLGASPQGEVKRDVAKMSDEEFASMSKEEKARARGDIL